MKSFLVAFLLVLVIFSAEMEVANAGMIPMPPFPSGKWCGYSIPMKPCDNDVCDKTCIKQNTHGWRDTHGMCTDIPSLKDCYCSHSC
ncbi:hypothetical protein F2Q70_00009608 [Brassica cretica]|nr:hypothetical protein F2Q70_00009608 [Brassica cretica]KAF3552122.1 hypothetical protein DY000_02003620 [Brassica cretica]